MRYIFTRTAVAVSSSHPPPPKIPPGMLESEKSWIPRRTIRISQTSNTSCSDSCLCCGIFTSFEFGFFLKSWNLPKKYCHLIYHISMLRDNENKYTASKYMLRDSGWGVKRGYSYQFLSGALFSWLMQKGCLQHKVNS